MVFDVLTSYTMVAESARGVNLRKEEGVNSLKSSIISTYRRTLLYYGIYYLQIPHINPTFIVFKTRTWEICIQTCFRDMQG